MSIRVAKRLNTAAVSISSATDTVVVSSSANTRISIVGIYLRSTSTNTLTFKSRAADNTTLTSLSGAIPLADEEVLNTIGQVDAPAFAPLAVDCDFVITTGSANAVVGWVTYTQETV